MSNITGSHVRPMKRRNPPWLKVRGFETGRPGFDPQSPHDDDGGVPLGKAHFLAWYWFVHPVIMNK